eukprot:jgi/Ulvmu1/9016/UM005_0107.1
MYQRCGQHGGSLGLCMRIRHFRWHADRSVVYVAGAMLQRLRLRLGMGQPSNAHMGSCVLLGCSAAQQLGGGPALDTIAAQVSIGTYQHTCRAAHGGRHRVLLELLCQFVDCSVFTQCALHLNKLPSAPSGSRKKQSSSIAPTGHRPQQTSSVPALHG